MSILLLGFENGEETIGLCVPNEIIELYPPIPDDLPLPNAVNSSANSAILA